MSLSDEFIARVENMTLPELEAELARRQGDLDEINAELEWCDAYLHVLEDQA